MERCKVFQFEDGACFELSADSAFASLEAVQRKHTQVRRSRRKGQSRMETSPSGPNQASASHLQHTMPDERFHACTALTFLGRYCMGNKLELEIQHCTSLRPCNGSFLEGRCSPPHLTSTSTSQQKESDNISPGSHCVNVAKASHISRLRAAHSQVRV